MVKTMAFEINLLLFNFILPLLVTTISLVGVNLLCRVRKEVWIPFASILFLVSLLFAIGVSNSGRNFLELSSEDPWRRLPWLVLLVGASDLLLQGMVALWNVRQAKANSEQTDIDGGVLIWLLRNSVLLALGWWLVPRGEAWKDTASMQPIWILLFAQGAIWVWWGVCSIRRSSTELTNASDLRSGMGTLWRLWIVIGPLLVMVALAGQSFASLAESLLTLSAIGLGIIFASWRSKNPLVTIWSEGVLSAALAGGTVIAMIYSSSSVPNWSYWVVLTLPVVVSAMDAWWRLMHFKMIYRLSLAVAVTALVLTFVVVQVIANQPVENW
ncbi:MAG: hypothetical protein RLY14_1109 [Planctomycetota bacterium]